VAATVTITKAEHRRLKREAKEFSDLVKRLECTDDPFAAWETVELLKQQSGLRNNAQN
jgi:hypothetical protein